MSGSKGRLVGVSLGPGDPELLTRAAWTALETAQCWAWPVVREGAESYALSILKRTPLVPPAQSLPLVFPMTLDRAILTHHWQQAARTILDVLALGVDVHFLVEGDASFYATYRHLERVVRELDPHVESRVIPGVASPLAAASLSGRSLCDGDETVAVIPATVGMEAIAAVLDRFQVLVLMKVRPVLQPLLLLLEQRQIVHKAVFVERAGAPEQQVIHDVSTLKGRDVHYLSLMIIHNHDGEAGLGMKERLESA
ncbi:MAG TPA: precorrin-2 C(20)-methyltransferase [Magnetococcales bacterium]|nr:precorrin-2 C(20)-methyltransferase [Magnetococcales bacterium]